MDKMNVQKHQQQQTFHRGYRILSLCIFVVLLLAATGLWILNIENIVLGPWSNVLNPVFTCISIVLALLQWHEQSHQGGATPSLTLPDQHVIQHHNTHILETMSKRKGAIIVYAGRRWRGASLYLIPGFTESQSEIYAASNIVRVERSGRKMFLCIFPAVQPGKYTIMEPRAKRKMIISIYAGHITEVDWP